MSATLEIAVDARFMPWDAWSLSRCVWWGFTLFAWRMLGWLFAGWPAGMCCADSGPDRVQSLSVILITGSFFRHGAPRSKAYDQFALMGMENQLGTVVNGHAGQGAGPVLAGAHAGGTSRQCDGGRMGTLRVTEQIDALTVLGANLSLTSWCRGFWPACLLIPALTLFADGIGVLSGWAFSTQVWHRQLLLLALLAVIRDRV